MAACRSTSEWNAPRRRRRRVMAEKKASTALSHGSQRDRSGAAGTQAKGLRGEPEAGVWWKVQRSCRSSQALTFGCLWVALIGFAESVSRITWTSLPAGTAASTVLRKRMNS